MPRSTHGNEIFVEFTVYGPAVKVTAIDSATGTEASIIGPVAAARATLEAVAVRKLEYLLKKQRGPE